MRPLAVLYLRRSYHGRCTDGMALLINGALEQVGERL